MAYGLTDYLTETWDPGVIAPTAQPMWFENSWAFLDDLPQEVVGAALYEPALPTIAGELPSPNLYATHTPDYFRAGSFIFEQAPPTQQLWDTLALDTFRREPLLSDWWTGLNRSGPLTTERWHDFQSSSEFPVFSETLALQTSNVLDRARDDLARVIRTGGRLAVSGLSWLLNVRPPSAAGVAIAVIKQIGVDRAINLAERGIGALKDYVEDSYPFGSPAPYDPPRDPLRKPDVPPGFLSVYGGGGVPDTAFFAGIPAPAGEPWQFYATESPAGALPTTLYDFGGWLR